MWNPNEWPADTHEYRIYGDNDAKVWAVVDQQDYQFLLGWLWSPKKSRRGKKVYLRRVVSSGPRHARQQTTVFLHQAVMDRKNTDPPSPLHIIIDHRNGDGLDCRRSNLRWATRSMNSKNINGKYCHDLIEG